MTVRRDDLRQSLMTGPAISGFGPLTLAMIAVVLLALALIALLLWENQATRTRALADARLVAYHESRILGESTAQTMEIASLALNHLAQDIPVDPWDPRHGFDAVVTARLLAVDRPWFPPLATLAVHDVDGHLVAMTGLSPDLDSVAGLPFFEDHRKGALDFQASVDKPPATVRISRRLTTVDGQFAGIVSAVIAPTAFDIARDFDVTRRVDGAMLVLPSGRATAAWPAAVAPPSTQAGGPADNLLYAGLPATAFRTTGIDVIDTDAAIVALTPVRNAPLVATVAVSKARVLTQWRARSWQVVAAVIAIVAVIGLVGLALGHLQARRRAEITRILRVMSRALEDSPIMVLIASPNGRVEYVNHKLESVSGFRREEIIGQTPRMLVPEDPPPAAYGAIRRAAANGEEWNGIVANRKKSGEPYWASLSISPIRDARGRIVNFVGVAEDVTDRVDDERHLRQVEKAEALGNLAGGVAHEFNNMLMPIISLTGEVHKGLSEDSRERRMLGMVLKASYRARDLVKRILVFSGESPDRWRPHDVSHLVEDCLDTVASMVPADIALRREIPTDIGRIHADAQQIEAVIANLVSNAVRAMKDGGGELIVTLERLEPGDRSVKMPTGLRLVPHAVIRVADSGSGIAAEILPRIFDPFFTTEEVGEGTGLGLSVVHGVVTAHGGAVTVDSTVGAGTTFSLFLPLSEAEPPAEPADLERDIIPA